MKNKILIFFLIFAVLISGAIFYVNQVFLPVHAKQIVLEQAEKFLHRSVKVKNLHFSLFTGLALDDLTIYQKDNTAQKLLHLDKAAISVNLISFFLEKKMLIPSIEMYGSEFFIYKNKSGEFSFNDLLPQKNASPSEESEKKEYPKIIIERLVIENASVSYIDDSFEETFNDQLLIHTLRASLSFLRGASFVVDASIPNSKSKINIDGDFNPITQKGSANIAVSQIAVDRYQRFIPSSINASLTSANISDLKLKTKIDGSKIDIQSDFALKNVQGKYNNNPFNGTMLANALTARWNNGLQSLSGNIDLTNFTGSFDKHRVQTNASIKIADASMNDKKTFFKGSANFNKTIAYINNILNYEGTFSLDDASININGSDATLIGKLSSLNTKAVLASGQSINGDVSIPFIDAKKTGNNINATGNVELTNIDAKIDENISFLGNAILKNIDAKLNGNNIKLTGNIDILNADARLSSTQHFQGDATIADLKLNLTEKNISLTSSDINIQSKKVQFDTYAFTGDARLSNSTITVDGATQKIKASSINFNNANIKLDAQKSILGNLAFNDVVATLSPNNINATFNGKLTTINATLDDKNQFNGNILIDSLSASLKDKQLNVVTSIQIPNSNTRVDAYTFAGQPKIALNYNGSIDDIINGTYTGSLSLNNATLTGLPVIDRINNITGEFKINTNTLTIDSLTLSTLDTPVNISGAISNFNDPIANLSISSSQIDLSLAQQLIPEKLTEMNIADLAGFINVKGTFKGPINNPAKGDVNAAIDLKDISLTHTSLKRQITKLNGQIAARSNDITLNGVEGLIDGKTLKIDGSITDFEQPRIQATANMGDIILATSMNKVGNTLHISQLQANAYESSLTANGLIDLNLPDAPQINITSNMNVKMKDIPRIVPHLEEQLKQLNAVGTLNIDTKLQGPAKTWQKLRGLTTVKSNQFIFSGYTVNNLNAKIQQSNGQADPITLTANIYDGKLDIFTTVDLTQPTLPFDSVIKLEGVDISKFIKDFPSLRTNKVAGWFTTTAAIKGILTDPLNLTGNGSMNISEGYLREIKVFKGLFTILNPILNLEQDIIISKAQSNFDIKDKRVVISNGILSGSTVGFTMRGWVDLNKNIEMTIDPQINTGGFTDSNPFIQQVSLPSVRITNTITEPKYDYDISAGKVIEKTIQNTIGNVFKLFE